MHSVHAPGALYFLVFFEPENGAKADGKVSPKSTWGWSASLE
jgi:hypothetical protein